MVPILADATRPISYKAVVESVDVIYQDVAHADQAKIALVNAKEFLKDDGFVIMQIKARSIDSTLNPSLVYKMQLNKLENEFTILNKQILKPFYKDHLALIAEWRKSH
jgi:fibrillarin-like pre-rRNA processing protein